MRDRIMRTGMLLLAPGPVEMDESICEIGSTRKLPYFRGQGFARTVLELTEDLKYLFQTRSTPLTVTASGTGLMEMAIVNLLNRGDKVVVLNGGTFASRWVSMCRAFGVEVVDLAVELGRSPDMRKLDDCLAARPKALLVNAHETSTGYLYDIPAIGRLTDPRGVLLIVDAVSSIGADEFRMDDWHVDCALVSVQKALALMPGLGFIAFSERAKAIIPSVTQPRAYFDALDYLANITRGMTPFTPAMNAILQAAARLAEIKKIGIAGYIRRHADLAAAFREAITSNGYALFPERSSNAMTAFGLPDGAPMSQVVKYLREEYDWWLAPNPTKREDYLRVSHMGHLTVDLMRVVAGGIVKAVEHITKGNRQ